MRRVPVVHVVAIVGIAAGVFACAMIVLAAGRLLQDLFRL